MIYEYHVLTIGWFTRNIFWGESESQAYRDTLCTSAFIKGGVNIVTDPSLPPEQMEAALYNRSGLRPLAIDAVYITHAHGDHYVGIECFPDAGWYMSEIELEAMKNSADPVAKALAAKIKPAAAGFLPGVDLLPLPGHTPGTTAITFDSEDGIVAVCGDAVMTRDFFRARRGYRNSVDFAQAAESISLLAKSADVVVPGHDNCFLTWRNR